MPVGAGNASPALDRGVSLRQPQQTKAMDGFVCVELGRDRGGLLSGEEFQQIGCLLPGHVA